MQRLRPNKDAHKHRGKKAKMLDIDQSHYLSDKDGSTVDIFSSQTGDARNGAEGLSNAFNASFLDMLKSPSGYFSQVQALRANGSKIQS